MNINYIIKLIKLTYWWCNESFIFNNHFHWHLQKKCIKYIKIYIIKLKDKSSDKSSLFSFYIRLSVINQKTNKDYRFHKWHYVTTDIKLSNNVFNESICLNTECIITLIDRNFLKSQTLIIKIECLSFSINVQKLESNTHQFSEYINLIIYLLDMNRHITVIEWETYIVKNLKTKMLIDIDILTLKFIIMNMFKQIAIINSCNDIQVSFTVMIQLTNQIN